MNNPDHRTHSSPSVLAIDPSVTATGYAVLSDGELKGAGKIETSSDETEPYRLWVIYSELASLIEEFNVDHVAVEAFTAFYVSRKSKSSSGDSQQSPMDQLQTKRKGRHDRAVPNPRSMFLMKGAQTAAQFAALHQSVPLYLYSVADWKGGPSVSKEAIMKKAQTIYNVQTRNHNITDAIMIGHHHLEAYATRSHEGVVVQQET